MLTVDAIIKTLKPGYTVTPITMIRKEGTETCFDTRPLYGPDGKWLQPHERGEPCGLEHTQALRCKNGSSAHRHKDHCYHRVHANVEAPGLEIVSADGKFKARVFDGAEVSSTWRNPNIVAIPRRPKGTGSVSEKMIAALAFLPGVEAA